jgi:hypothetical protein
MLHLLYGALEVVECIFDDHTPVKKATVVKAKRNRERMVTRLPTGWTATVGLLLDRGMGRWLVIIARFVYHKSTSLMVGRSAGRRIPAPLNGLGARETLPGRCYIWSSS